jgi:adenylate kinase
MNLILLGPPGAGKGTQAKRIHDRWGLIQLSTGEILREAVEAGDDIGVKAGPVLAAGNLVPDEIVFHVVAERLRRSDCQEGFMLDGFPRTTVQARVLDNFLNDRNMDINAVIQLVVDNTVLTERINGRYACSKCNAGYHAKFKQPKIAEICDVCGSKSFERREDDNAGTVRSRLKHYHLVTEPILPYYRERGVLFEVDGMRKIDKVAAEIDEILAQFK